MKKTIQKKIQDIDEFFRGYIVSHDPPCTKTKNDRISLLVQFFLIMFVLQYTMQNLIQIWYYEIFPKDNFDYEKLILNVNIDEILKKKENKLNIYEKLMLSFKEFIQIFVYYILFKNLSLYNCNYIRSILLFVLTWFILLFFLHFFTRILIPKYKNVIQQMYA